MPLVFTTPRRNAINRSDFNRKSWHPALHAAGITPTRATGMHALRHFYASALLDAGARVCKWVLRCARRTQGARKGRCWAAWRGQGE